jgi:FkbM family methyltransferase
VWFPSRVKRFLKGFLRRHARARQIALYVYATAQRARLFALLLGLFSDPRSLATFLRWYWPLHGDIRRAGPLGSSAHFRLRPLAGRAIRLRFGTSDGRVLWETFGERYHLPPPEVGDPSCIWDLGANIGLTMADFAVRFPRARIVGVELDDENAALCRQNTAAWCRCDVIRAAVWPFEGEVQYWTEAGDEYGARVFRNGTRRAPVVTLNALVARTGPPDFVKMDVEGAERELLRVGTAWVHEVGCIKVEVHPPYDLAECRADLEILGFSVERDSHHFSSLIARRP